MHFTPPTRLIAVTIITLIAIQGGCDSMIERADTSKKSTSLDRRNFEIDVQPIMRGTIASESAILGDEPTIVRSYGLVVGLKGTGSRLMPAPVRAAMLQEMSRRGVGDSASGWGNLSPEKMLDSEDTAIVVVEGVIPAGGVKGEFFDLRVSAAPGTGSTSLEGGRLYTSELRPGELRVGSKQSKSLAVGRGQIFINPFVEPDASGKDSIDRLTGRILDGGIISENMPLKLRMAVQSHAKAMQIQSALNSRFPKEPGQTEDTARGKSGDEILLTVPPSFAKDPSKFLQLVRHSSLQPEAVDRTAMAVRRSVLANPGFATEAAWRWKALGPKAVPMLQGLYDYPEEGPRLAALTAGAYLSDPRATPELLKMAQSGATESRISCIQMLGRMRSDPTILMGLRSLLNDENVDVRLITFEALEELGDPLIQAYSIDGKFTLNLVPSEEPLIYMAQTGTPRIVLFGEQMETKTPLLLSAWSNRLILKSEAEDPQIQVYFKESPLVPAQIYKVDRFVPELVRFFGHDSTIEAPAPGIGLSYSETIGAIYRLWSGGYIAADFKAEQDRVQAALRRARETEDFEDRAEFDRDLPSNSKKQDSPPPRVEQQPQRGDTVPR